MKQQTMEELYEVGPRNLWKNFCLKEISEHEIFFVISRWKKNVVI